MAKTGVRWGATVTGAALVWIFLAACAATRPPLPWVKANEFMRQIQWERYKAAEAYVPPRMEKRFHDWAKEKAEKQLKITNYTAQQLEWLSDTTAVTRYDVTYFIYPEYLEKTTEVEVSWRLENETWLMNEYPKFGF